MNGRHLNQNGIIDEFTNGLDDNGIGGVDDLTEVEGPVPPGDFGFSILDFGFTNH